MQYQLVHCDASEQSKAAHCDKDLILVFTLPILRSCVTLADQQNTERISNETWYSNAKHAAWAINRTRLLISRIQAVEISMPLCPAYTAK